MRPKKFEVYTGKDSFVREKDQLLSEQVWNTIGFCYMQHILKDCVIDHVIVYHNSCIQMVCGSIFYTSWKYYCNMSNRTREIKEIPIIATSFVFLHENTAFGGYTTVYNVAAKELIRNIGSIHTLCPSAPVRPGWPGKPLGPCHKLGKEKNLAFNFI